MSALLLAAALAAQQPDLRDADSATRLLASLRTADAAVCELAGRSLTNNWGWTGWLGDAGAEPLPLPMPMPVPMPMPHAGRGLSIVGPRVGRAPRSVLSVNVLAVFPHGSA